MPIDSPTPARAKKNARRIGLALAIIHALIAVIVATSFGTKGSEWWPVIFYPLQFPLSIVIFIGLKHFHIASQWALWGIFLVTGSFWHFYWPQGLLWAFQKISRRAK